jgi:uncharacterized protein YndB with AHSA1/START domain
MTATPQSTGSAASTSIALELELPHPPAKVWRALTEPALLSKWLMATDLRPVVGQHFTFTSDPTPWWDGIVRCEVQALEPERRLRYSWRSGKGASTLDTVVTWTLTPTPAGGTRLGLEHTGFTPTNKFAFDGARTGWQHMIGERLRDVLGQLP